MLRLSLVWKICINISSNTDSQMTESPSPSLGSLCGVVAPPNVDKSISSSLCYIFFGDQGIERAIFLYAASAASRPGNA